jgi:5-methyltetrahydrofolate--homocysteine methyltransferase
VTEGLNGGIEAGTLLGGGFIAGMAQVGELYEEGEIFVPEMLVAARAMTAVLTVLKPHLVEEGVPSGGKVAIGTTQMSPNPVTTLQRRSRHRDCAPSS